MHWKRFAATTAALSIVACAQVPAVAPIPLTPDYVIEGRAAPTPTVEAEMARLGVRTVAYKPIRAGVPGATVILGERPPGSQGEPLFQVASISKSVSAMGVLRLVETRGLDLDADINGYLRSWKIDYAGYPTGTKVTIRQLLSHTGGLSVHGFPGYSLDDAVPDTVGVLTGRGNTEAVKLFQAPGAGFSYSGGGTTVLQLLVEDQTGESFSDYIQNAVLAPFEMDSSHYRDAPGGSFVPATGGRGEYMGAPYHIYPERGPAGLWATPSDLAQFLLVADAVIAGQRPDLLAPALGRQIVQIPGDGQRGYALGFAVERSRDHEVIGHNGSNFGYKSLMFFDRKTKDGFVVMTGSEQGYVINDRLARGFAQSRGLGYLSQGRIVPVAQGEADWARIVGTWTFNPGTTDTQTFRLERIAADAMSALNIGNGESHVFYATGPLQFIDPERRIPLTFATDADGGLEGLVYGSVPLVRAK